MKGTHTWRSEDNFQALFPCCHHVSARDGTRGFRLCDKRLSLLSHVSPGLTFFFCKVLIMIAGEDSGPASIIPGIEQQLCKEA